MSDKKKIEIISKETEELRLKVQADLNTDLPDDDIQKVLNKEDRNND